MSQQPYSALRDNLRTLRDVLPDLADGAGALPTATARDWLERLRRTVLPAIDYELPMLLVGICGGGSTGKSTLLNALTGRPLASVGFRAGLTTRVLLVGHPAVLSGAGVAESLLHRLGETPVPWRSPDDTVTPGPPLYATSEAVPRTLLYIDTPDFDTGDLDRLINRERAEPILRTAEVIVYVFTNTVYNNLSNTRFMAEMVGGIGGRPIVLVYRISRTASDAEVLEHCLSVARRLYAPADGADWPDAVVGIYRMHESDAVALGEREPTLIPIGVITRGRPLESLLADLDVTAIKRHAFAGDLAVIHQGAQAEFASVWWAAREAALYRRALQQAMTEHALQALTAFPAQEAVSLAVRLFLDTSPAYVRVLRGTGRVVGAPLRAVQALSRRIAEWSGAAEPRAAAPDLHAELTQSLLEAANNLRNRLMDDPLILRVSAEDDLMREVRTASRAGATLPAVEAVGPGVVNLHFAVPQAVRRGEEALRNQDWPAIRRTLQEAVPELAGLPEGITQDLRTTVRAFRGGMSVGQRLRELFFASLTALPPIVGVTYTLLTANPVAGAGLWIQVESLFGLNDLWALLSIPASLGLSEEERRQLEGMIAPVFRLWLERRAALVADLFARTICWPTLNSLDGIPAENDPRLTRVDSALQALEGPRR
ncbi:MAG TPA: GTPase domain-containing protein [Armatimonadota bacterium]|nr:GTPase domain-containing protein [Armatimonadota bacterium]